MNRLTKLLKVISHFKELNSLAPSAPPPLASGEVQNTQNARILRLNFLSDLSRGACAVEPLYPGYATDCNLKILVCSKNQNSWSSKKKVFTNCFMS